MNPMFIKKIILRWMDWGMHQANYVLGISQTKLMRLFLIWIILIVPALLHASHEDQQGTAKDYYTGYIQGFSTQIICAGIQTVALNLVQRTIRRNFAQFEINHFFNRFFLLISQISLWPTSYLKKYVDGFWKNQNPQFLKGQNTGSKHAYLSYLTSHYLSTLYTEKYTAKKSLLNKDCSICLEELFMSDNLFELPCGHVHHLDCISQWRPQTCPLCREEYFLEPVEPVIQPRIENFILQKTEPAILVFALLSSFNLNQNDFFEEFNRGRFKQSIFSCSNHEECNYGSCVQGQCQCYYAYRDSTQGACDHEMADINKTTPWMLQLVFGWIIPAGFIYEQQVELVMLHLLWSCFTSFFTILTAEEILKYKEFDAKRILASAPVLFLQMSLWGLSTYDLFKNDITFNSDFKTWNKQDGHYADLAIEPGNFTGILKFRKLFSYYGDIQIQFESPIFNIGNSDFVFGLEKSHVQSQFSEGSDISYKMDPDLKNHHFLCSGIRRRENNKKAYCTFNIWFIRPNFRHLSISMTLNPYGKIYQDSDLTNNKALLEIEIPNLLDDNSTFEEFKINVTVVRVLLNKNNI